MTEERLGNAGLPVAQRLWGLLRGNRRFALAQVCISLAEGFVEAAILTLFARIALSVVAETPGRVYVPALGLMATQQTLVLLTLLIFARLACGIISSQCMSLIQSRTVIALRREVVAAYLEADYTAQSQVDHGGLQQVAVTTPNAVSGQISGLLLNLGHLIIMISMLIYATVTYATLTLGLVAVIFTMTVAFRPLRKWIKARSTAILRQQRSLSTGVAELSALKLEIQTFGISQSLRTRMGAIIKEEGELARRIHVVKGVVVPLYTTVTYLAVTIGLIVLSATSDQNLALVGPILLVILRSLAYGQSIQSAAVGLASLAPSIDFLDREVTEFRRFKRLWGNKPVEQVRLLEFDSVSYSYPASERRAVNDIRFQIRGGQRIGIVGPSGGGKTTLIRLLLGLLTPSEGFVKANGSPLQQYELTEWNSRVGVVPQHANIFSGTVAENIRLFRAGIDEDDLWEALDAADLTEDVRAMPLGLETRIGEGGRALSGGQLQRLAIARALISRPDFIVMDEPTSSIDTLSEASVSEAINRMPRDTTVVIVSHRMRILQGCDELIVIEGSKLTAKGPPEDLMSTNPYLKSTLIA